MLADRGEPTFLGDRALEAVTLLRAAPLTTCVLSDFDGTLAPIVDDPARSAPLPGAVDTLHRLARRYGAVAVVSGRPVAFLATALRIGTGDSPLEAYGLYGAEHIDAGGLVTVDEAVLRWKPAVAAAADELRSRVPAGVAVEDKAFTLTVHWRSAPGHEREALALATAAAASRGLEPRSGRMSIELVPPVARDKGMVVRALASGTSAACFLGDDAGDIAAFRALAELSHSSGGRVVRIAVASSESPAGLLAEADVVLDGPPAALAFLERLVAAP